MTRYVSILVHVKDSVISFVARLVHCDSSNDDDWSHSAASWCNNHISLHVHTFGRHKQEQADHCIYCNWLCSR